MPSNARTWCKSNFLTVLLPQPQWSPPSTCVQVPQAAFQRLPWHPAAAQLEQGSWEPMAPLDPAADTERVRHCFSQAPANPGMPSTQQCLSIRTPGLHLSANNNPSYQLESCFMYVYYSHHIKECACSYKEVFLYHEQHRVQQSIICILSVTGLVCNPWQVTEIQEGMLSAAGTYIWEYLIFISLAEHCDHENSRENFEV